MEKGFYVIGGALIWRKEAGVFEWFLDALDIFAQHRQY